MCCFLKKMVGLLLAGLFLTGCVPAPAAETSVPATTAKPEEKPLRQTEATDILESIWSAYAPSERFSIYGGMLEAPVADSPGELDMDHPASWIIRYRIPVAHLKKLDKGAAFSHLMNEKLLTATVFHVTSGKELLTLASDWRRELQRGQWIAQSPQRLLLAVIEQEYLFMAFGSISHIETLKENLRTACPELQILYYEAMTA